MPTADVFVSYASEDRFVAEEIARELIDLGIPTFYDRFVLEVGDSVIETIDRGLAAAKYGVVIVSPHSLTKAWPTHELRQLLRAHIEGRTRLLPVWHNVTRKQVREHAPALEDIWAANTSEGLRAVVRALAGRVVEATVAVVPLYQRPAHRFLNGEGELTLGFGGPAFTIWEALIHFDEDKFPLYVEGETIDRKSMLSRAAEALARPGMRDRVGAETVERISEMCRAEIDLDPADLLID